MDRVSRVKRDTSSYVTKKDRPSNRSTNELTSLSEENDFGQVFNENCARQKVSAIPIIQKVTDEPAPGDFPSISGSVKSERMSSGRKSSRQGSIKKYSRQECSADMFVVYSGDTYTVSKVLYKNCKIDRPILIALRNTLNVFASVYVLKIEFASLDNIQLRALRTLLIMLPQIKELSIDGNPNPFQNFYILFKGTRLSQASLAHCQINSRGVRMIANQLAVFEEQPLYSLNLASNCIDDEGARWLADMLRINRQLKSLTLSDNWITDDGYSDIMEVLQKFALRHDEIVLKRKRVLDRLKKKSDLVKKMGTKDPQSLISLNITKSNTSNKIRRKSSTIPKTNRTEETPQGSIRKITSARDQMSYEGLSSRKSLELLLGGDKHPFVKDSFPENKEIYCRGNFNLIHLNVGYNKLTLSSANATSDTLRYQKLDAIGYNQAGLKYVMLEGNRIPSDVQEEIKEIAFGSSSKRSLLSQDVFKRKRSSASSTGSLKNMQR